MKRPNYSKAFGTVLRAVRERSGKTQGDIARFLGCSVTYVSDVERGSRAPFVRPKVLEVASFLDADPIALIYAAAMWSEAFELPMGRDKRKDDIATILSARWESLGPDEIERIAAVLEDSK